MPIEPLPVRDVAGWTTADPTTSRAFGDRWIAKQRTCVLRVPSVIVPTEYNVLINPAHAESAQLAASGPGNVNWDKRLKAFLKK